MKENKGFTLIELLAVIVILAIIALIATPMILGVIETARQGSAKSSALGYIDAVEKQIAIDMLETDPTNTSGVTIPSTGTYYYAVGTTEGTKINNINVKGETPTEGYVVIDTTGTVTNGTCLTVPIQGKTYYVTYDGRDATISDTACQTPTGTVGPTSTTTPSEDGT